LYPIRSEATAAFIRQMDEEYLLLTLESEEVRDRQTLSAERVLKDKSGFIPTIVDRSEADDH